MVDEPSKHFPNRIEIELHTDADNMARSTGFSIPLYRDRKSLWRQGLDGAGEIDVAVIEIERSALPRTTTYRAFTPGHLAGPADRIEIGTPLLVVCFPLGFHDTLHHVCVVRHAIVASSYGLRFAGKRLFPHRCTHAPGHQWSAGSNARRRHGSRTGRPAMEAARCPLRAAGCGTRDPKLDEALGLNCAWYADILLTLTER